MRRLTSLLALLLVLLGVGFYVGSGFASVTALIPAFFGLAFGLCAWLASTPSRRKHAMHAAAVLALLGLGGAARGVPDLIAMMGGEDVERPDAAIGQGIMIVLCAIYLAFAIRSFRQARAARGEGAGDA